MPLTLETLLDDLADPLSLRLAAGRPGLARTVGTPDLHRPGLALCGVMDYFPPERMQILGKTEVTFWETLAPAVRRDRLKAIFDKEGLTGFVVSHGSEPPADIVEAAEARGVALMATAMPTTKFISELTLYLEEHLAPSVKMHGSLIDVFGVGVLLVGESGIGKSECALALVEKGHRLCADDVVEIRRTPEKSLLGTGARQLRHHMEIRGLGIVDVKGLFGARAVRDRKLVELVVKLTTWEPGKRYDRTGLEDRTQTILDIPLDLHEVPVKTGRNLAVLIEVAAMNWRLKQMGVNSAAALDERVLQELRRDSMPATNRPQRSRYRRHEES